MNVQSRKDFRKAERRLPFECVALVLQGGGALGAYQAGVYEALAEADIHPDWVAGISIGAINAAIIAGNSRPSGSRSCAPSGRRSPPTRCSTGSPPLDAARSERRPAARALQPAERGLRAHRWRAGLLHVFGSRSLAAPGRHSRGDELLRHQALKSDARAACRLRPDQCRRDALQRRRGERAHRQFRLFRQRDAYDPARARDGERRAAARLSRPSRSRASTTGMAAWSRTRRCNGWSSTGRARTRSPSRSICGARAASFPRNLAEVATRQKEIQYSSRTRANTDQFKQYQRARQRAREPSLESCPPDLRQRGSELLSRSPTTRSTTSSS